ncbi:response regulator [Clostridiaceae bacterium]|nr:response regulator [Clostridiaceae bacterium]RKI15027.1 response regulator [bacterium 1XD21-70]
MSRKQKENRKDRGFPLIFSIVLVFCILGMVVFSVARRISAEMSTSAIHNLSESLGLIKGTIEAILNKEADFQKLIAQELTMIEDPEEFVRSYKKNGTMVRISLILEGETEGVSNVGETFSEESLDFSAGKRVDGLLVSQSYLNSLGTWAYTIKCPVLKDEKEIASLYMEYIYDSFDEALPGSFYNGKAMLYIMDAKSERLVLKPKGMGERIAGHLNLQDFYRANDIMEPELQAEVEAAIDGGKNIMFYHDIRDKDSLIYMWAVNGGGIYLIGYVPIEAIQQEGKAVNQNIIVVVLVMLVAFFLCCLLYYFNQRQQNRIRREREAEREIHNKQLAEALQAAQIASKSKTTFLSNMSHDIRTPMNAILGFTTLLAKDAENPAKVREYTRKIMASGQHLLSLINDVLDVSKIESGKVVLTIGEFTLNNLVSSVDAIIRPMANARNQSFDVTVTGIKHECLVGDETRINQILINLLSNAVKYTPRGGNIWFRIIGLPQRSGQYEHIRIEVEDDGYGMTPEYLKTIFEAFTRAENSTTNKVQGTGLGMAITKNIVELMGGSITVSSEVDKGSIFRVELELRIPDGQADREFWEKSGISRILAIDDDKEVCENIQMLMKNMDVVVDTALSGEEALLCLREAFHTGQEYQMVLLDWKMPDMDGVETAKQIRGTISGTLPILFLTAYDGADVEDEIHHVENAGILAKPFFVSTFKEKILEMKAGGNTGNPAEEAAGNDSLEGLSLLVAEDNEINAEILSELLDVEGATCEIVENGQLAVERFERALEGEFDAILMDVQMPVMNGYEASRAIRKLKRGDAREIPIIAMTANAFAEDVKDALDAGMNVHISKPIDMALLKKTLNQWIRRME